MIDKDYRLEMFHYLKERGYNFIENHPSSYSTFVHATTQDVKEFCLRLKGREHYHIQHEYHIKSAMDQYWSTHFIFDKGDHIINQFFIDKFNKSEKDTQADLLKNIGTYTDGQWREEFEKVFLAISGNKKELLNNIHAVSIVAWTADTIDVHKLDGFIQAQGFSDKEVDGFYLRFFKARKNQIKDVSLGPVVRDFLLEKYNRDEERLSPYFSFFNFVKYYFEPVEVDFEDPAFKDLEIVSLRLSCKRANELLCIDNFPQHKIKKEIESFSYALQKYHGSCSLKLDDLDSYGNMMEIRFYGKELFTKAYLKEKITNWLLLKKVNQAVECNHQNVHSWLLQEKLKDKLVQESAPRSRVKI